MRRDRRQHPRGGEERPVANWNGSENPFSKLASDGERATENELSLVERIVPDYSIGEDICIVQ